MEPRITVLTLAVENLDRALRIYRDGLGLPTRGVVGEEFENGAVAFFKLRAGLTLALWPRKSLACDTGLPNSPPTGSSISIGHNVESPTEVDEVMKQAERAGAKIVKQAQTTFYGGYAGYFQDLDGHLWEVVFNPGFSELTE